jgi:hypothetical protein
MAFHTSNVTGQGIGNALSNDPANPYGDANAVRELWRKGVEVYEQSTDFFAPMEGGKDAIIQVVNDTSKGRGQKITFTQMAGLYDEPHHGDDLFNDETHFESIKLNTYNLSVDFLRHGVRYTERAEEYMGMRGEVTVGIPRELGKWMGRQKSEKLFMSFLHRGNADGNLIYANNKQNLDQVGSADVLDWDTIVAAQTQLSRLGGSPAKAGRDKSGNVIDRYATVATTDALFSLEQDSDFKTFNKEAGPDSYANVLFGGGYTDVRGNIIKKYNPIDHDGFGAIASPLNPKAILGCSTTDGFENVTDGSGSAAFADTTDIIYAGGTDVFNNPANTSLQQAYFKYFPGYAFKFIATDTLSLAASMIYKKHDTDGNFHVLVYNHTNATTDAGKWNLYRCTKTGNAGHSLVVNDRLVVGNTAGGAGGGWGSAVAGSAGSPAWDATINTSAHTAGEATIYYCNMSGVTLGHSLFLGKAAARRGYGKYRNNRTEDSHEGGFVKDIFVTSVFGQEPCEDAAGRKPGFLVITHALQYAGISLPTVTLT